MNRKRRLLFGNNVGRGAAGAAAASFSVTLLSTLVPQVYAGSSTPTFTRATTAYVTDFEGLLKQVPSGCARLSGARFVQNRLSGNSNNVANASWSKSVGGTGSQTTTANYAAAPDGTTTASRYQWSGTDTGANYAILSNNAGGAAGQTLVSSVWLKSNDSNTYKINVVNVANNYAEISITPTWQRFARLPAVDGTNNGVKLIAGFANAPSAAGDILVWGGQCEQVDGQSNQNPSEYVSVGVLAAPYHGAGVDGCKYFTTQNGNTVASNIVSEATGAAISSATLLGYQAEGARTNTFLQSQTLTAGSWAGSGATCTADQYVAPDGTTAMDKITASAGAGNHYRLQGAMAVSAGTTVVTAYVKYVNHRWIVFYLNDGTNNLTCSFDLLNGVVGARAAGASSSSITATATAGVYRIQVVGTTVAGNFGSPGIVMNNADAASIGSWTAAGTEVVGAWGFQIEAASFASSYIPTTTVAVARNASIDSYVSASNIAAAAGSIILQFTPSHTPSGTIAFWGTYVDTSNYTSILHDATNLIFRKRIAGVNYDATIANAFVAGTTYKMGCSWGAAGTSIVLNGTVGTPHANTTAAQIGTNFQVGADGNSLQQPFASIKYYQDYTSQLTDAALQTATT